MVICRKRLNSLEQIGDPQKFFDALLCDIPSLVEENREVFEAKAQDYYKKCQEYKTARDKLINWTAVEAAIKKATSDKQEVRRVHCTTLDKSLKPLKDGLELTETQITKDGLSFGWDFWAPPDFPSNPDNWFLTYNPQYPRKRVKIRGDEEEFFQRQITIKTITLTPKESLLRDYGVIAVLYNQYARNAGETPIEPEILSNVDIRQHYETPMDRHHIWPDVKKYLFESLTAVNRDLASKQKKETKEANDKKTETPKQPITLKSFIKTYCDLSEKPDIDSKCEMLMREHRQKRIKLPLFKHKFRPGQRKLYYFGKLLKNWPTYGMSLTTLPPLKKSDNK